MAVCWKYGVIFFNTFHIFGFYYSMVLPASLQNEIVNSPKYATESNNTSGQPDCKECLGLGEVRYNILFSVMRWAAALLILPSGYLIDKLGINRSVILLNVITLLGSLLFALGAMSHGPTPMPMYLLMVAGRGVLAFGDGTLRVIQAKVIAYCFPKSNIVEIAFSTFGLFGEGLNYYITPNVAKMVGLWTAVWLVMLFYVLVIFYGLGVVACVFSLLCAIGLVWLLKMEQPQQADDYVITKVPTLKDIQGLPVIFWVFIWTVAFIYSCSICNQVNLSDYIQLRYDYTMTVAGYIIGIRCLLLMSAPAVGLLLRTIDCNGVVLTVAMMWMTSIYILLGFCPTIHPLILVIADGIGSAVISVTMWQLLIVISPAPYVGTLGGMMYFLRHITAASILLVSGYVLEKHNEYDVVGVLYSYQHFFLMLITLASISVVCVIVLNVLDIRKTCALNLRIGRWKKSDSESTELMSGIDSRGKYS